MSSRDLNRGLKINQNYFTKSRARVVLYLLNIHTVSALARVSGMSHGAVEPLLYKPSKGGSHASRFIRLFESLSYLYDEAAGRKGLSKFEKKFVRDFILKWAKQAIVSQVKIAHKVRSDSPSIRSVRDHARRVAKRRVRLLLIVKEFEEKT